MGARHLAGIRGNPVLGAQAFNGAVNNRAKFGRVSRLAPHCQRATCLVDAEPGGVAILFLGSLAVTDFEEESLYHGFLDTTAQPGVASWLQVEVKMLRLDCTNRPGLL
jgi:hypothetical protein